MKVLRYAYLTFVLLVAGAHLFFTLSTWMAPAFTGTGGMTWFVALLAAWVLAAVFDLILSLYDILPLSFAIESVMGLASLAILSALSGGVIYVAFAALAPTLVLVKAAEQLAHVDGHFHHVPSV